MKTVFINGSPKKSSSASSYFLWVLRPFVHGEKVTVKLRNKKDFKYVLAELSDADNAVFCMPLYVDSVPSHVLEFLKVLEQYCLENELSLNVWSLSNNGYIEGCQSEPLVRVMENFCARAHLVWRGGLGIGGGVMLNVTRTLILADIGVFLLLSLIYWLITNSLLFTGAIIGCSIAAVIIIYLNMG
ncbi:MAG: hypothetical protein LUB61_02770, partial [Eggerthellaceae bacterium]|nr:hypothetical protein [Eggerthellaceae bacterium]